jgi:hypothetical protein
LEDLLLKSQGVRKREVNKMIDQIFREYGDEYKEQFFGDMPVEHLKVISAIQRCKTQYSGVNTHKCKKCGSIHTLYRSCGNRNCPLCQHHRNTQWLDKRMKEQLPGPYFMVTFTVPEELRSFMRTSQSTAYNAFFKASSEALKKLIADPKYIGGDLPGFFGVLHTWGRQLQYHPHIHFIVPGGALSKESGTWQKAPKGFLVPVHALSKVVRGIFHDEMKKLRKDKFIDPDVWKQPWNVNSQYIPCGSKGAIKYLAPYVFRVGISNSRIINVSNRKVTFKYRKTRSNRYRTMTLDVIEFIRRFLQHVLPSGFMKVRYYGFMGSGCSIPHQEITTLIEKAYDFKVLTPEYIAPPELPPMKCDKCGGELVMIKIEKHGFTLYLGSG